MEVVDSMAVETAQKYDPPLTPELASEQAVIREIAKKLLSEAVDDREAAIRFLREGIAGQSGQSFAQLVVYGDVIDAIGKLLDAHACGLEEDVELMCILTSLAELPDVAGLLADHAAVTPLLVRTAQRATGKLAEQVAWMFGQLARDSPARRDAVLEQGGLTATITILNAAGAAAAPTALRRTASWALGVLCDESPAMGLEVRAVLAAFISLVHDEDEAVLSQVCWGLSHICDGPVAHIRLVVESNLCARLVALLSHPSDAVSKPALRTIGNIVCAEDDQDYTQHVVDCGAVPPLAALVTSASREIQKEACWTLSNIAAGTTAQIDTVLRTGAVPHLVALACDVSTDPDVRGEACWVLLNAASCGSDDQIAYLVRRGCARVLVALLQDPNMVMMALEGIEKILAAGSEIADATGDTNPYASAIDAVAIAALCRSGAATPAVKKALRVWDAHYVTCALCRGAFSKRAGDTRWCNECKCFVCGSCNCTVYHLTYQSELWREEAAEETAAMQQKRAAKRNKRARKRKRIKQKKALQRRMRLARERGDASAVDAAKDALAALHITPHDDDDDDDDEEDDDASADIAAAAAATVGDDAAKRGRTASESAVAARHRQDKPRAVSIGGCSAHAGVAADATAAVRGAGSAQARGRTPHGRQGDCGAKGNARKGDQTPVVAAAASRVGMRNRRDKGAPLTGSVTRRSSKGISPPLATSDHAGRRRQGPGKQRSTVMTAESSSSFSSAPSSPSTSPSSTHPRNRTTAGAGDLSPDTDSTEATLHAPADDSMRKNDELVDFLTQTGSILALAQMLDDDAA